MTGLLQPLPDTSSPQIQQIQTTYGVAVSFKQRTYATTVTVRGSMSNAKSVKDATAVLIEHLTGNIGRSVPVSMQLEIAPQHHLFIIGRNGGNIKQILQQTGATIRFPDPNNSVPQRKGTVYISGTIESVFLARQQLIGCLPLVLMFDMKEDTTIEQAKINQLMEQLDVYISIKPKPKQPSKSVIVKSIERNTANLYEARRRLLGLMNEAPIVTSSNQGDQMTCANRTFGSLSVLPTLLSVNTTPQVFLVNGTQSPLTSPHGNHTIGTPGLITAPTVYHPLMVLQPTPGAYAPLTAAAAYQLYHQNGITKEAAGLVQNGLNKDVIQAVSGTSKHKQTDVSMEHLAQQQKQAPRGTTGSTRVQTESPESHRHKQMYTSDRASPSSDHHSSHSASSINSSVPGSPPPTSTNGLDLISNVMSMSLLGGTSLGNLQFTKNDLQDAVSSIQSEPNLLKGLLPANSQASTDIMSMDVFGQHSSNVDSMTSGLQRPTAPSGSALNNSSSAPTRRVKTPPGFSGPPRGRSDVSPLRQLQSHYESPQTYYESSVTASNASNSPLSFSSSGSSLGLGGSTIHPRQDSPLGGLGSPLVSGGSPLGGSGSPLTTPGSPICRNHSRLFQNGETRSSESGCDSDGSDRAPGSNRPQKANPSLFSTSSMFASFDYEQKKLLATKAMQKKPEGESRIPTDFWSGLGFSKSMPDTNLRERFKSNNIRYNGPSMTTTYECVNGEESEMWADGAALAEEVAPPVGESLPSHISAAPGEFPSPRKKMSEYTSLSSSNHIDVSTVPSISHDWPPKADLTELFSKLGLGKYIDLFTQQEIDLSTFLTLTDHDLKELGISTFGARRKMLLAIADLKKQPSLMSSDMGRSGSESNSANNNNSGSAFRDGRSLPVGPRCRDIASQSGRW